MLMSNLAFHMHDIQDGSKKLLLITKESIVII